MLHPAHCVGEGSTSMGEANLSFDSHEKSRMVAGSCDLEPGEPVEDSPHQEAADGRGGLGGHTH